jgi:2',3'-cyclic-nucleotide 2'-phosphodiesterase / 3'-nucleotidase
MRVLLCAVLLAAGLGAAEVRITVLATTDVHGNLLPYDYFTGKPAARGLAKVATIVRAERAANPNTLLIDCGDTIQGTPLEYVYQRSDHARGEPLMLAMNAIGYDALTLGNHDFNYGLESLNRARAEAHFPWLSANTVGEVKPFQPYLVKTVGGVKVAVIGVTTTSIPLWERPGNFQGYRFLPIWETVARTVEELRAKERPAVTVVALHEGLEGAAIPAGVDAVIYGHTHRQEAGRMLGDVLVVQPKNWASSVAKVEFRVVDGKVVEKHSRLIPVTAQTPAAADIVKLASPYHEAAEHYLNTPVAEAPAAMEGRFGRIEDTALVDAVQEVQLAYTHADVSFTALFNPRARVEKGPITVRQLAALYIYDNELYAIEGDGEMVKAALENAARYFRTCPQPACTTGPLINREVMGFNYDMAQGVTYEVDLRKPAGERIVNLRWKGRPLAAEQKLRIALNNYRAGGSAGYTMFRGARVVWQSSTDIRDLMISYYTGHKRLPSRADGNWRIVPAEARQTLEREALEEAASTRER